MLVVADSTPLNYLILIEHVNLLENLFESVLIPPAVYQELTDSGAPEAVRLWISSPPRWMAVASLSVQPDPGLAFLDRGEREAITLAEEKGAGLLLDEADARREAKKRDLKFIGTLGVLREGAARGLLDLPAAIDKLLSTSFYVNPKLISSLLNEARLHSPIRRRP